MTPEISDMGECEVMISLSIGSCTRMTSDAHQGLSQRSLPHYIATHLEETLLQGACWLVSTLDGGSVHSSPGFRARAKIV